MTTARLLCCLAVALVSSGRAIAAQDWPHVTPISAEIYVVSSALASARFTIFDTLGVPAYSLECHTAEYHDASFDYSGDWECRLQSATGRDTYSTLLVDNPSATRDWQSRGRFLADQLLGKCADYPEYGRVRNFRLRGMKLNLTLGDIVFTTHQAASVPSVPAPALKAFRFSVSVEPDITVTSAIAEPVPYEEPPYVDAEQRIDFSRECETIRRKVKP